MERKLGLKDISPLFRRVKVRVSAHFPVLPPGVEQQADILYLPDDGGDKYALVLMDYSRKGAAVPLRSITQTAIIAGLRKIWGGKSPKLPKPRLLVTDNGPEFKSATERWLTEQGVGVRHTLPGRKRQTGLVEFMNLIIGKYTAMLAANDELATRETAPTWSKFLDRVVDAFNEVSAERLEKRPPADAEEAVPVSLSRTPELRKLLAAGTKVYVALQEPRSVEGDRLHGAFRAADIRFNIGAPKTIESVVLVPGRPPMYKIVGESRALYYQTELLPVDKVKASERLEDRERWTVERVTARRKRKGKLFYLVKWEGYDAPTWEPAEELEDLDPALFAPGVRTEL
jgi:hypothetical protein